MIRRGFFSFFSIVSFLLFFSISSPVHAEPAEDKNVSVRLFADKTEVRGGETITVGIEQKIREGWHTYWINAGDSGTPARIAWSGIDGIKTAAIQWPAPKKLPMGPLVNFGFEYRPVLLQDMTLPEDLPDGPKILTAKIDILACHDICIPETHTASLTLNGADDADQAAIERARAFLPLDMGWPAAFDEKEKELFVRIKADTPSAFADTGSIELYPEEWGLILNTAATKAVIKDDMLILTHPRGERALSDVPVSKFVVTYRDASGARKAVRVSAASETAVPASAVTAGSGGGENGSFLAAVALALLGGLILNLMPCVFPVLSMKALSLAQLQDKDTAKARRQGLAYTAGILACFAVIAGALLIFKAGGAQVGWGFQLQHPAIILFLAYLFFGLGLNLAGYFEISGRFTGIGQGLAGRTGMTGSFFTGVLATLVATPCTAPFMGAAMGYALTQPAYVSMTVFMALGLGLALPYLALCFIPAVRHIMPKPGAWMETFRQFLAFPMFASACWLVWVLAQQIGHMDQFAALLGMLAMAFGLWLWRSRPRNAAGRVLFILLAVGCALFIVSTFFTIRPVPADAAALAQAAPSGDETQAFTRTQLEAALKADDPVFVNMTAAWCITCKVNEKVALATEATQRIFRDNKVVYFKGDWTNQNPEITAYLEEFGRSGVPIYVYYGPRESGTGVRPAPVVLPQILTPSLVANAILLPTNL